MADSPAYRERRGPFRADQVREGDPYELSGGHAIRCLPTGARGSAAAATGSAVLRTDPMVQSSGVETGYTPAPDILRAPDVAVGNVPDAPGWVRGAPPLAVEYADQGQDEADLAVKIREFLASGTRFVWVVRLTGPRRVEVHEAGCGVRTVGPGEELSAPGVLQNPVPVEALYDWEVGEGVALRNLLQRRGYRDLDAVLEQGRRAGREQGLSEGREQGKAVGLRAGIFALAEIRGLTSAALREAVDACEDVEILAAWLRRAATAADAADVVEPPSR